MILTFDICQNKTRLFFWIVLYALYHLSSIILIFLCLYPDLVYFSFISFNFHAFFSFLSFLGELVILGLHSGCLYALIHVNFAFFFLQHFSSATRPDMLLSPFVQLNFACLFMYLHFGSPIVFNITWEFQYICLHIFLFQYTSLNDHFIYVFMVVQNCNIPRLYLLN